MSVIFAADYDDADEGDGWDELGLDDDTLSKSDELGGGSAGDAAAASEAAAFASFDQDAADGAKLAAFQPPPSSTIPQAAGGTMRLLGTAPPSITGGITNHNATAGSVAIHPTTAISSTSKTPRTTPTLVSTASKKGNHVFFAVLFLALVFFAWREQ